MRPILTVIVALAVVAPAGLLASDPGNGNWPMWGGTPDRNMVSSMKGLPTEWDVKTKKNIKWVAELGSQSYGNPVVADGMVFVGTPYGQNPQLLVTDGIGGSPYGPGTLAGPDGSRQPVEVELTTARNLGSRLARVAGRLNGLRASGAVAS